MSLCIMGIMGCHCLPRKEWWCSDGAIVRTNPDESFSKWPVPGKLDRLCSYILLILDAYALFHYSAFEFTVVPCNSLRAFYSYRFHGSFFDYKRSWCILKSLLCPPPGFWIGNHLAILASSYPRMIPWEHYPSNSPSETCCIYNRILSALSGRPRSNIDYPIWMKNGTLGLTSVPVGVIQGIEHKLFCYSLRHR